MLARSQAKVDTSGLEINWFSRGVLSELPFPGTKAFGALTVDLEPFKIDPTKIVVETPSNKLSDVGIRFGLANGNIELAFFYTGFRLLAAPLHKSYPADIGQLTAYAVRHLGFGDLSSPGGHFKVRYDCHLRLDGGRGAWRTTFVESLAITLPVSSLIACHSDSSLQIPKE